MVVFYVERNGELVTFLGVFIWFIAFSNYLYDIYSEVGNSCPTPNCSFLTISASEKSEGRGNNYSLFYKLAIYINKKITTVRRTNKTYC